VPMSFIRIRQRHPLGLWFDRINTKVVQKFSGCAGVCTFTHKASSNSLILRCRIWSSKCTRVGTKKTRKV
jgi:hypothetical protein